MDEKERQRRRKWLHSLKEGDSTRLIDLGGRQIGVGRVSLINPLVDVVEVEYPACKGLVAFSRSIGIALEKNNFDRLEEPQSQAVAEPSLAQAVT